MGTRFENNPLIVDISHYNGDVDVEIMAQHDIAAVIAKCGDGYQITPGSATDLENFTDPKFAINCDKADDAGLPFGAYFFFRPELIQGATPQDDFQFRVLRHALKNKTFQFLALDLEVGGDTASNIRDKTEKFIDWMEETYQKPVLLYTRVSYITDVVKTWPRVDNGNYDLWLAQYIWTQKAATWETLKNIYPLDTVKIKTPGNATWKIWQWATLQGLDGISGEVDINFWNGDLASFYEWLGLEDPIDDTPPAPIDDPIDDTPAPVSDTTLAAVLAELKAMNRTLSRIAAGVEGVDVGVAEIYNKQYVIKIGGEDE